MGLVLKTSAKRYYRGVTVGFLALAAVFIIIPLVIEVDEFGKYFAFGLAGLCLLKVAHGHWRSKTSHPESTVYESVALAPSDLQLKYYQRILLLGYVAFPLIVILDAWELYNLEHGKTQSVSLWWPQALVYNALGYWPTVILPVILFAACIAILRRKISQLSEKRPNQAL